MTTSPDLKPCAWVSRHAPKDKQRAQLRQAGYRIVHVAPDGRLVSGRDAWQLCVHLCGEVPALAVVKMPMQMLVGFMSLARRHSTKVVISRDRGKVWLGEWALVEECKFKTRRWTPDPLQK